jgi:hypothetical protein
VICTVVMHHIYIQLRPWQPVDLVIIILVIIYIRKIHHYSDDLSVTFTHSHDSNDVSLTFTCYYYDD